MASKCFQPMPSTVEAFLYILQETGIEHRFRLSDGENRILGIAWTYAWCEVMWKRFQLSSTGKDSIRLAREIRSIGK